MPMEGKALCNYNYNGRVSLPIVSMRRGVKINILYYDRCFGFTGTPRSDRGLNMRAGYEIGKFEIPTNC